MSATLRVQVHYYEDGNVQLQSSKEVSSKVPKGDDASMAQKLFKLVLGSENEYQVRKKGGISRLAGENRGDEELFG